MSHHWDPELVDRLARLAALDLTRADRHRLAGELAVLAAAADRLPPVTAETGDPPAPVAGPGHCRVREDRPSPWGGDPWPPAVERTADGWLQVPPVREEKPGDT